MPLLCTAGGSATLGQMKDMRVDYIQRRSNRLPLTLHTLTALAELRRQVRQARRNGHALAVEECLPGELTLGKAIINRQGEPMAAIHIATTREIGRPDNFRTGPTPLLIGAGDHLSRSAMIQQRP